MYKLNINTSITEIENCYGQFRRYTAKTDEINFR